MTAASTKPGEKKSRMRGNIRKAESRKQGSKDLLQGFLTSCSNQIQEQFNFNLINIQCRHGRTKKKKQENFTIPLRPFLWC